MRTRLLITDEHGDTLYVGPLVPAQRLVNLDRYSLVAETEHGFGVSLHDVPTLDSEAEWGAGETLEEAWRYALGAYLGPDDEGYDEHHLWTLLQLCADPCPIPAVSTGVAS